MVPHLASFSLIPGSTLCVSTIPTGTVVSSLLSTQILNQASTHKISWIYNALSDHAYRVSGSMKLRLRSGFMRDDTPSPIVPRDWTEIDGNVPKLTK